MDPNLTFALQVVAYIGMALGVIGTVAPIIPGPILIWLGVLLWAWADGFEEVGWPTLIVLALLAVVAEISDLLFASLGAKQGGASWRGLFAGGVGAVIGLIVFSIVGAIIGAIVGILAWETYRRGGDLRGAFRASRGLMLGYIIAMVIKFSIGILMLAIFAWQAFYGGAIG